MVRTLPGLRPDLLSFLALPLLSVPASAQAPEVTLAGSWVESIRVGGQVYDRRHLRPGISSGEVLVAQNSFAVGAADGHDLGFYFSRDGHGPEWDVHLGSWRDENGLLPDFFLFEYGGNEPVEVAPRLLDGTLGSFVPLSGWTALELQAFHGPNRLQTAHVLAFGQHELRDADGTPLAPNVALRGLRLRSSTIDAAALLAHEAAPPAGGPGATGDGEGTIEPAVPAAWRPMQLSWQGPWASATSSDPNPFLDLRMTVRLDGPGGLEVEVPGFFDGDGASGLDGFVWSARFTPPVAGLWRATVGLRRGPGVALDPDPGAGVPTFLEGAVLDFQVVPGPPMGKALVPRSHAGEHYLRDLRGQRVLKGGSNSPENFLAYRGFAGVEKSHQGIGILHRYDPHRADWEPGDPLFRSDVHAADSKGIVGALNYLASMGVNSQFAMLMNLGGDGQDVHPFLGPRPTAFDKTHYHPLRLRQWNQVFEHAASRGIAMHFGLAETETANETWLDGGELGVERKLFYREMVARFAHLPGVKWTLCEETDFYGPQTLRDFAAWIADLDAYGHPIAFHNNIDDLSLHEALAGAEEITATSQQYLASFASGTAEYLRQLSAATGRPWVVEFDEIGPAAAGLSPSNADELRKVALYDVLLSGAGIEWYMGWIGNEGGGDLNVEDFRTREPMWNYMRHARLLLEQHTPFWRMEPSDELLSGEDGFAGGGQVLAATGEVYVVYLPRASATGTLDLTGAGGRFEARWYDPRTGEFVGGWFEFDGGAPRPLGPAPAPAAEDWALLVQRPSRGSVEMP